MADKEVVVRGVDWRQVLSVGHLLRAFRMAIWPPSKLLLCLAAIALTVGCGALLDQAFKTDVYGQSYVANMTDVYRAALGYDVEPLGGMVLFRAPPERVWDVGALTNLHGFWYGPLEAFRSLCRLSAAYWNSSPWFALLNAVIALLVWSFFGGAVCRMAAIQFARDERLSVVAALKFACQRYGSLVFSPLALFAVVLIIAGVTSLPASLVLLVPYIGPVLVGLATFVLVVLGVIMALLVVFGVASLGLQTPAIAADGRDFFDAVSRAVDYVVNRPWRYGLYTAFSLLYLSFTFVLVRFFAYLALKLPYLAMTRWPWSHTGGGDGGEATARLGRIWVAPTMDQPFQWPTGAEGANYVAAILVAIAVIFLLGLMVSFIPSFLLTGQTIIYFLLRRQVDLKDLDDVQIEEKVDGLARLEKVDETVVEPEPAAGGAAPPLSGSDEDDSSDDG